MIINISKTYPNQDIESNEWYKLNNNGVHALSKWYVLDDPIINKTFLGSIAECPECQMRSVLSNNENYHAYNCPNKYKIINKDHLSKFTI